MVALQKDSAGKVWGTRKGEFLGSAAVDGAWHKTPRSQWGQGLTRLWLSPLFILAGGPFRGRVSRRGLPLQRQCWRPSISGLWGCCLSYLSCFWCAVAAPPAQFPSQGLPWFFLCLCGALHPSRQTLPCPSADFHFTNTKLIRFFPSLFHPLRPRHVISHCWVIPIVLSSKNLASTLDLGGRSDELGSFLQTTLHSPTLLSEWERTRGTAKLQGLRMPSYRTRRKMQGFFS